MLGIKILSIEKVRWLYGDYATLKIIAQKEILFVVLKTDIKTNQKYQYQKSNEHIGVCIIMRFQIQI